MTRYLPLDQKDLVSVLKMTKTDPDSLVALLAKALRSSLLSDRSREFKNHILDFLKNEGKKIWGSSFSDEKAIGNFNRQILKKS